MHSISTYAKIATVAAFSASMLLTTGCAPKRATSSEVVVAPMGIPGNALYGSGGALVNNSAAVTNAGSNLASTVYFAFDSSEITSQSASILNPHAALLSSNPSARVLVAGHTDERGSREYNHALGERRAQAVKSYLTGQGVGAGNVETISYGEERPAVQGNSEEAYAKNRRAELSY